MKSKMRMQKLKRQAPLHLIMLPGLILLFIFSYIPMYGVVMAFQKFIPAKGLFGAQEWVGLKNFKYVFELPGFKNVMFNTLSIAIGKIVAGFIITLVVTLMLNEIRNRFYKRTIQTIIYFPHFLSWVILAGILIDILSPSRGIVNVFLNLLGVDSIYFLGESKWFQETMIFTDVWKEFGFGTVIYLAAITGIDPTLYEAASIDGANRWKQTLHVTLPGLRMIIVLLLVLNLGNVLNAGFDQIFNMLSVQVLEKGDIIDTMVYRIGLMQSQYGVATAVGLFKSIISCGLISTAYYLAYKLFDYRLF